MTLSARRCRLLMLILSLILSAGGVVVSVASLVAAQTPDDIIVISQETFGRLAEVYNSGGDAPELVAKLNDALQLAQEARLKRLSGDEAGGLALEEQARVAISEISDEIPAAQQQARQRSMARTLTVLVSVPVVVALSTLIFYVALKGWRWYDKTKLFEMTIVEKNKEED